MFQEIRMQTNARPRVEIFIPNEIYWNMFLKRHNTLFESIKPNCDHECAAMTIYDKMNERMDGRSGPHLGRGCVGRAARRGVGRALCVGRVGP